MSNQAALYSKISGREQRQEERNETNNILSPDQVKAKKAEMDAIKFQAKHQWMQSSTTKDLLKSLDDQYVELIANCIDAAYVYPHEKNADFIVQKLIRAREIQMLVKQIITINEK